MPTRITLILFAILLSGTAAFAELPKNGLVLHLDASALDSITFDSDGKVTNWSDQSGKGHNAVALVEHAPVLIKRALNAKNAIRFSGNQWMDIPKVSDKASGYSIFIVYQRVKGQAGTPDWQRLISSTDDTHRNDTKEPAFHLGTGEESGPQEPQIAYDLFRSNLHTNITLGAKHLDHSGGLHGDIAEVIIYDRSFLVFEPIEAVQSYLREKWNITAIPAGDWTYKGPLPQNLPKRISDELPLSDQKNTGKWTRFDPLWDEFNGDSLDTTKWWDHNPLWYGRAPSRYLARNVKVTDGFLHITMSKDPSLPAESLYRREKAVYKDYVAASVVGKEWINYGYFEIRAKPMASAASSAWWFTGTAYDKIEKRRRRIEIDVFELGGKSPNHESSYNMNAHEFKTEKNPKHVSLGGIWKTPEPLINRYWTFGLEWTPDTIKYYVDGVLIRQLDNDRWHGPQAMIFDTETMISWLGTPQDGDLPSTFTVDYVRTWTNPETQNNWQERYDAQGYNRKSSITDYVRSMDP